ncbi:MAG TPA: hypothetical protein VI752_02095 [Candidatus Paceibacterota bacterium]
MKNNFNQSEKGFTLIETFVAVLILVFAVIGPLGLLSKAIADGNYAKNQVTAYYLAQEALELVINQRDRNLVSGGDWLSGLRSCSISNPCKIYFDDLLEVEPCTPSDNESCRLYIGSNNKYTHSGGEASLFSRYMYLSNNSGNSTGLSVVVKWMNKNQPVDFALTTQIFDFNYEI